ncbi:MAG: hypothetical protein ACI8QF_002368 [Limisphaerales bacterium]|jgi:hypothetical protein
MERREMTRTPGTVAATMLNVDQSGSLGGESGNQSRPLRV